MEITIIETTIGNIEDAKKIADTLVSSKFIACAQIVGIVSFYSWKGKIQADNEFRITMKTAELRKHETIEKIKELHSYEVPEILHYRVETTSEYGNWCVKACQD